MTAELRRAAARVLCRLEPEDGPLDTPCWIFQGALSPRGYGMVQVRRGGVWQPMGAHRVVYLALVGPVPPRAHVHHECDRRACANPAHLRALAPRQHLELSENAYTVNRRRETCPHGHPLDGRRRQGKYTIRRCLTCHRERSRATYRERRRAA